MHVWCITCGPTDVMFKEILEEREKERADRFKHDEDARRFITAHAATRFILARYLGIPPESIRYRHGAQGKPEVDNPNARGIAFNLSHSGGIILMAVVARRDIGVDVEEVQSDYPFLGIARRHFSDREVSMLRALPRDRLQREFYRLWTRKEACLKAMGMGLSVPMKDVDVLSEIGNVPAQQVTVDGSIWTIIDLVLTPGYAGAVAVNGGPVKVIMIESTLIGLKPGYRRPI